MAVTIDNVVSNTATSATSLTVNKPANIVAGDLIIFVSIGMTNSASLPSGFSALLVGTTIAAWSKVATDSEPASYAWSWAGVGNVVGMNILIKNSQGVRPVVESRNAQHNTASASVLAPALTAVAAGLNGQLLMNVYMAATSAGAITVPVGQSNIGEVHANSVSGIVGYETITAVGTTGTRTATAAAAVVNDAFSILFVPTFTSSAGDAVTPIATSPKQAPSWSGSTLAKHNPYAVANAPVRKLPWWEADITGTNGSVSSNVFAAASLSALVQTLLTVDISGSLSGVIEASGVPVQGVRVNVHWRANWQRIWTGYTDASGAFDTGARFRTGYAGYVVTVEMPGTGSSPPYTSTLFNSMVADKPLPL